MQSPVSPSVVFRLQPSSRLRWLNGLLHLLVLALLVVALVRLELTGNVISILKLLAAVMAMSWLAFSAWQLDRRLALAAAYTIRYLQHDSCGWSAGMEPMSLNPIQLQPGTTVTALAAVLVWRDEGNRRGHLLLTPAMLGQDDYRRLCRLLWQAGKTDPDAADPV